MKGTKERMLSKVHGRCTPRVRRGGYGTGPWAGAEDAGSRDGTEQGRAVGGATGQTSGPCISYK